MVTKTTLETRSASLLYFVARIDEIAAAGIAETRITTDLNLPVRFNRLTDSMPSSKPTANLSTEAYRVVGSDVIFTLARLLPSTSKTRGITIKPMKFNG